MNKFAILLSMLPTIVAAEKVPRFSVLVPPVRIEHKLQPVPLVRDYQPTYRTTWTWPGGTEFSLRRHLIQDGRHGFDANEINRMTFAQLKAVHSSDHEHTLDRKRIHEVPNEPKRVIVQRPTATSCPGGVCPINARPVRRGLFGLRRR